MARSVLSFQNLFCAAGMVVPLVMLLAPKGVVPVLVALALTLAVAWALDRRDLPGPDRGITALLGLLAAWAAAASLWSYQPGSSLVLALRVAAVLGAGSWVLVCARALTPAERAPAVRFLAAGFSLALVVLLIELYLGEPIGRLFQSFGLIAELPSHRFNRGTSYLAILAWPVAAGLWPRLGLGSLALPALLLALVLPLSSLAAIASLLAAFAVVGLALVRVAATWRLVTAVALLAVLATPLLAGVIDRDRLTELDGLPGTTLHRMHFWSFTGERIAEAPLFGWGFDSSRDIPAGDTKTYTMERTEIIPLHPHNASLQVWLELGAVGALLLAGLAWALLRIVGRLPKLDQALGLAMFSGAFVIASVSFGLWQNQWISTLIIAAFTFEICRPGHAGPARPGAVPVDRLS